MGRCIELRSDESQAAASLCKAEATLDFDTIRVITVCSFAFLRRRFFFWTPQSRTGYTDTLALAESSVVPIAVYLIDQHPFGIASGSIAVSLYCRDEHIRFIVSVKG